MNPASNRTEPDAGIFEVNIDFNDLTIDKYEIGLSLGYSDGKIPSHFAEVIDGVNSQLPKKCRIKAGYRLAGVKKEIGSGKGLDAGGIFFHTDKIVAGHLKKSEKAALFACTIGSGMETWAREEIQNGDPALGYIIDTVASAAVERAADVLHDQIGKRMQELGLKITNRYSPGYCNWPVSEQHLLFSLFPDNFCGITLTHSALMMPIKSISGIIGVGKDVERKDYSCDNCGIKDCTYKEVRIRSDRRK